MLCPYCREKTFVVKKNIVEGWKVVRTVSVCALCGAALPETQEKQTTDKNDEKLAKLGALLGGETVEKITLAGEVDRDFCRSCRNFIVHPFKTICALNDQEVDPMSSCERFKGKDDQDSVQPPQSGR